MEFDLRFITIEYNTDDGVSKVLSILSESFKRGSNAHFNSNSFNIKFDDLTRDDDYNMACIAFYNALDAWNKTGVNGLKYKNGKPFSDGFSLVVSFGECFILGSYLLTKLREDKLLDKFHQLIIENFKKQYKDILRSPDDFLECINDYIGICALDGHETAKAS